VNEQWQWLASSKKLQEEVYGYRFDTMSVEDQCAFLTWNVFAAYAELNEAASEFKWKPWTNREAFVNADKLVGEVVDVAHFLANMLLVLGVTDEEYQAAYQRKQQANRDRQAVGYTGLVCHEPAETGLCSMPKNHEGGHRA
jgi:hypothetical protein